MGFFDKLFGRKPGDGNSEPEKTSEPLNEDLYWKIVSKIANKTTDPDRQEEILINELSNLPATEIVRFKLRTDQLLAAIYTSDMWCAAYIINGGCSDDGFEYFRCWVIARGKEVYYAAKKNPDSLISQLSDEIEAYEMESFLYAPNEAFSEKTGKEIYDFIDQEKISVDEQNMNLTWEEEDPGSMKAICPRLFEAKWDK